MPPAVLAVGAALAGSAAAGAGIGGALFGAGILGSFGAAVLADSVVGLLTTFAINSLGSALLTKKPKSTGGPVANDGLKTVLRLSDAPQEIVYGRVRKGGVLLYAATSNSGHTEDGALRTGTNAFLHLVIGVAGHEVESFEGIYLNDTLLTINGNNYATNAEFINVNNIKLVKVVTHTGADDQVADAGLVAEAPGWTTAHRLRGTAYVYVRLHWHSDNFGAIGVPVINVLLKGKKLYDPRTTLTVWSDNAALVTRDYLTSLDGSGQPYGFGATDDEVDDDFTVAAANICEESITKLNGTTIDRYSCNGVIDTSESPMNNMISIMSSMIGTLTCPRGLFRIYAGAYDTPEATVIDEDWLTGTMKSRARVDIGQLFNAVRGTYLSEAAGWQSTDFPPITSTVYEAEDNDERLYTDIVLPFTTDSEAAQRIAKTIQRKMREQITVTMPLNYRALEFTVWDTIKLTNAARGWFEKVFRIQSFTFGLTSGCIVQLKEENELTYDWSATDAEAEEAADDTNLPSAFDVEPAGALSVTEEIYTTRDGAGVKAKAVLTWLPSEDVFLYQYQAEYMLRDATDWIPLSRTDATSIDIPDIAPGTYDFRVKVINRIGQSSEYVPYSKTITGLSAPPTEPQNLTVSTIAGLAILRWDLSTDTDVLFGGGKFVFRHSPDTSSTWVQSTTIGNAHSGNSTFATLPLKAGVYLVKAVDSSGIESTDAASVIVTQATALAFADVTTVTEHPGFAGTKTDCEVSGSSLIISEFTANFSTIPDVALVPSVAGYGVGGVTTAATYDFNTKIDRGSVSRTRLTSHVLAAVFNANDLMSARTDPISAWASISGDTTASADAQVWVSSTDDDPAGAATWNPYQRLDSAEFYNRGYKFQLRLFSYDPIFNIVVDELSVTAAEL